MGSLDETITVDLLTREYAPFIYGGAGVHVTELAAVLRDLVHLRVRCFGEPREGTEVYSYLEPPDLKAMNPALGTFGVDLSMAGESGGADLVHSHTWYANLAGHLASLLHSIPHVVTAHSLEPLRPWKAEQLGGGYALSSWAEKTAYEAADAVIAVSGGMRADILRCYPAIDPERVSVVHNGIDVAAWNRANPDEVEAIAAAYGIDLDRPAVCFVGRITRQKGLPYLLRAFRAMPPDIQLVLCAGAPDTPELAHEVRQLTGQLAAERGGVVWIEDMLPRASLIAVLSACDLFVCPSVYEPLGIVNLEAMACSLPVVGTATGGIPEVIVDGETGWLVPIEQVADGTGRPLDPDRFVADLADTLTAALGDKARLERMGAAARQRVEEHFSWASVALQTLDVYRKALAR